MARTTTTTTSSHGSSRTQSSSQQHSQSQSESQSESRKFLDAALLESILGGLRGQMTPQQIQAYAENLLRPQMNAGLEAAQQTYETTKLGKEQEMENLAVSLGKAIEQQQGAYRKSMAGVETAALGRGMGRSSYTLQTLANQGDALARAVRSLTDENTRQRSQLQRQITQAAQHNAQTQGRLRNDYAASLAAKQQELMNQLNQSYNQNYLTAVSGALGSRTTGTQATAGSSTTTGSSHTQSSSHSTSVTRTR